MVVAKDVMVVAAVFLAAWLDHLHVDCCGAQREVLALAYRTLFSLCRLQALTPPTRS